MGGYGTRRDKNGPCLAVGVQGSAARDVGIVYAHRDVHHAGGRSPCGVRGCGCGRGCAGCGNGHRCGGYQRCAGRSTGDGAGSFAGTARTGSRERSDCAARGHRVGRRRCRGTSISRWIFRRRAQPVRAYFCAASRRCHRRDAQGAHTERADRGRPNSGETRRSSPTGWAPASMQPASSAAAWRFRR